ncbi:MAG: hypothetical protein J7K68_06540 [Candidatus Diapherotrites archaeon]|nr:hypothetical protein [Candidatus Diapherotrites archaeon]
MKTHLVIWFNSEGETVSEVTERLMSMGFRPVKGNYDFVYDWGKHANVEDALALGEKVQETLKGCGVLFKLETV